MSSERDYANSVYDSMARFTAMFVTEKLGDTLETDRIVLKQRFIHPTARMVRINSFKAMMRDGELQIFVDNGRSQDGRKNRANVRLTQDQMKQLVDMLQRNIIRLK